MEEPFMTRTCPYKSDYEKRKKEVLIYESVEIEDPDFEEKFEEETKEHWDKDQPNTPNIPLHKMNLQKLLDLLPEGSKSSDIKIKIDTDTWCGSRKTTLSFYYVKTFSADMKQYKKDQEDYDEEWKEYLRKKEEYDSRIREEEIEILEEKITNLKNLR